MSVERKPMNVPESKRLSDIPYMEDGAILIVESRGPKKKESHIGVGIDELK